MSDQAWAAAFVAFQKGLPDIPKSKTADIRTDKGKYSYSYADLPDIIARIRPVLAEHGLAFAQSVEPGQAGITVTTRVYHREGHVESFGPLYLPAAADAQKAGSAITYARRYSLCAALGIAADEDDDANSAKEWKAEAKAKAESTPSSKGTGEHPQEPSSPITPGSGDAPPTITPEDLFEKAAWKDIKPILLDVLKERAKENHFDVVPRNPEQLGDVSSEALAEVHKRLGGQLAV